VVTVSDRGFAGSAEDRSGPAVARLLASAGFSVEGPLVVPDEQDQIAGALLGSAEKGFQLVATTGGTGLAPRDVTPQATMSIIDFEVPGLAEQMRRVGIESTPMAMISRQVAGVRGRTLIVNLPGSPTGAAESLQAVLPALGHAVRLLQGEREH
jgi:molybdenum cofactor synthesis domain-containing protein